VAAAEWDGEDDETAAAEAVPTPVSPAIATVSPVAMIHAPFFRDSNRRERGRRSGSAMAIGDDPAGEWLVGS
jgi:hypothetical protein